MCSILIDLFGPTLNYKHSTKSGLTWILMGNREKYENFCPLTAYKPIGLNNDIIFVSLINDRMC